MTQEPDNLYTPESFERLRAKNKADQKRYRESPQERWGFPSDFAAILSLLDCIPTRDELRPHTVPPAPPPKEPRRKSTERLAGEAARLRNCKLTRERYARLTDEQRAERNRKRRAKYKETRARLADPCDSV